MDNILFFTDYQFYKKFDNNVQIPVKSSVWDSHIHMKDMDFVRRLTMAQMPNYTSYRTHLWICVREALRNEE